ncbi:hypothetical protein BDY17DRAFT_245033, partial [Neohortaea acidophila]
RSEIAERITTVQSHWYKTKAQLETIERLWASLSEQHQIFQRRTLDVLVVKLKAARDKLKGLLNPPDAEGKIAVKRWKYMFLKPHLDELLSSLENWQRLYDPSWYLLIRIADPVIDAELGKTSLIVDSIPCLAGCGVNDTDKDIRTLATKLHYIDSSTFGVLKCRGVAKVRGADGGQLKSFDLVLETPTRDQPRTLRGCLISQASHTLTERVHLAQQLAAAVNYVHTLDFVHKNIRPENLIGFGDARLNPFFLIGFEQVRSADGRTYLQGDTEWQKSLYRHPERQGLFVQERFTMQHDIYSLGVCLLEIGLWDSFMLYEEDGKTPVPNPTLLGYTRAELKIVRAAAVKDLLVDLARRRLPGVMGESYSEVVVNCLTCLDEDNVDFGDDSEFQDADGVAVGVRYIDKVCVSLIAPRDDVLITLGRYSRSSTAFPCEMIRREL